MAHILRRERVLSTAALFSALVALAPLTAPAVAGGKVYLVLGSDTAIWDGLDWGRYHCHYDVSLYADATRNASKVMAETFRQQFKDSFGNPLKLTWWMMAGNVYRYADNTNIPVPNVMTLHLMKEYHGDAIRRWGDELTFHYHPNAWSDENGDGVYYWNQVHDNNFNKVRDDFDFTLAQFLLEEETFPVSFRSGCHYMDNVWQQYLDSLLLYNMDNDWPAKRLTSPEPVLNIYDWSKASSEFVPFHPSAENYQLPGNLRGWNLRSKHIGSVTQAMMDSIFAKAGRGVDQVACLWGHLPEEDFLTNLQKMDSIAHRSAGKYTNVTFRYCTAVEAMQLWRGTADTTAPVVEMAELRIGDRVSFTIRTNEPIFQPRPFVAVKDRYERFTVVPCRLIGENEWTTEMDFPAGLIAKAGCALTDTAGNLGMRIIPYLPDDAFIDNGDPQYREESGTWTTTRSSAWGNDARLATLSENDTARVSWRPTISQSGLYNVFVQIPGVTKPPRSVGFWILSGSRTIDSVRFDDPLPAASWVYLATVQLDHQASNMIEMSCAGKGQAGTVLAADVLKISPLIRDRELSVSNEFINFGEIAEGDSASQVLTLTNRGTSDLAVSGFSSQSGMVSIPVSLPLRIARMNRVELSVHFFSPSYGVVEDTLWILSDDPVRPRIPIPFSAAVRKYFVTLDNEDSSSYREVGSWHYSNAHAYGPTSRYAWLSDGLSSMVRFFTRPRLSGQYEIHEIVPTTLNASPLARYALIIDGVPANSASLNQNTGSGAWVFVMEHIIPAGALTEVRITDLSRSTVQGTVLRANAIRFNLVEGATAVDERLPRSLPTEFALPSPSHIRLEVFDLLGRRVATLENGDFPAGYHRSVWNADGAFLATGLYICRLEADPAGPQRSRFVQSRKLMLLR